jgi:hypothetical protein
MTQELTDEQGAAPIGFLVTETPLWVTALLAQLESARALAVRLEQELAETQARCRALVLGWVQTGSSAHAAQLAEALELGPAPLSVPEQTR